jgi:hypothetical protein
MKKLLLLGCTTLLIYCIATALSAASIDSNHQYAYSENAGWLNFADSNGNVVVLNDHLEGYVWGENIGWIRLGTHTAGGPHTYTNDAANAYGVNRNSSGDLSGYAWGENIGWINFGATGGNAVLSNAGEFTGAVWAENIGWIKFNGTVYQSADPAPIYQLKSESLDTAPTASSIAFSGTLQAGETLTGSYTYADTDSDAEGTSTFKWSRSTAADGTGKTAISGATNATYVVSSDDVGKFISFEVTPVNSNATGSAVESPINSTAVIAANTAPTFSSATTVNIIEGNTAVITTVATDADSDPITYSLNGGVDEALFAITSSGVLSFKVAPSVASPSDSGSDNTYNVTVQASTGGHTTDQALTILVISAGNVSDDKDADGNGITDKLEQNYGSEDTENPKDGIPDKLETLLQSLHGNSDDITVSTDTDSDGMPDIAEVMIGRDPTTNDNASANAPTITVIASPLALRSTATLSTYSVTDLSISASDSLTPVAYYKNGACKDAVPYNYKTICNPVTAAGLLSGTQNLWWLLTDSTGNWGRAEQVLNIVPTVSFVKDLTLAGSANAGKLDTFLELSGDLVDPSQDLLIPYTVTGTASKSTGHDLADGNFTIKAGELRSEVITVKLKNTPIHNSTVIINLTTDDTLENSVFAPASGDITTATQRVSAGLKTSQTLSISSKAFPLRLGNLKGTQGSGNSEVIGMLFDNTKGSVTLSFDSHDPDGGSYTYSWTNSNDLLGLESNTSQSTSITINSLTAGDYYVEVQVTDSTATLDKRNPAILGAILTISGVTLKSSDDSDGDGKNDAEEGLGDSDGDGIPNYLDAFDTQTNLAPTNPDFPQSYLMKTSPGLKMKSGTTGSIKITLADLISKGNAKGDRTEDNTALSSATLKHLFDYEIEDVEVPSDPDAEGNSISIVLPLSTPLTADNDFKKYSNTAGWKALFIDGTKNKIEWTTWLDGVEGNCPDVGSSNYSSNTGTKAGSNCIKLTLQDGGSNDDDGVVDGRIIDPFGISTPDPVVPVTPVNTGGGSTYTPPPVDPCANISSITSSAPSEGKGECDFINYFVLKLDPVLAIDASVNYQTRDGSAKAGEDYVAISGTVVMRAGQTQLLIPVTIIADNLAEDDETFDLVLSSPTGTTFPAGVSEIVATHTIINTDTSYLLTPTNVVAAVSTTEGSSNHTNYFQLALDKIYDHDVIVSYRTEDGTAIAGKDYIATSRKIKITAGQEKVMIGVEIIADTIKESDETFSLVISNPIGENFTQGVSEMRATHTIVDDDS